MKKQSKPNLTVKSKTSTTKKTNKKNIAKVVSKPRVSSFTEKHNSETNVLKIENINKVYSKKKVVDDISFEVNQGEVVGLLGPNGAGKTTSFYIAVGLVKPDNGKVYFNGADITKYPMHKRSNIGIGYLPQEASVFRKLSVRDNVLCILETRNYPKQKRLEKANQILEELKVSHVAEQYGYTLSGGERRRVEIARALAGNPKIILLDEPFAGVDPIAVKDIQNVIKDIQNLNIGILITDHNVRETLKIVSRAYIMSEGKIILKGSTAQLVKSKLAREVYLGEDFKL